MEAEYKVKSLAKAMRVLECFSTQRPELGITEIASMLGLHKSTVHNIVTTLVSMGYLTQNMDTERYYLGLRLLHFGYIINNHMGIREFFLPYMKEITRTVGETVYLGIPHERDVLYIECVHAHANVGVRNILGERASMHCTGLGKAMLAFLPESNRKNYVSFPMRRFTENTITDPDALLHDLEHTRARGYSIDNMEHEHGIICIGVPVFGVRDNVVAALSISAPSLRLDSEIIERNAAAIQEILAPAQHQL